LNISKPELQAVIRTLPIGLYIKRGVAVSVGDGETSFYSPNTDTIEVSFPQIELALSKVPDNSPHKEQIIQYPIPRNIPRIYHSQVFDRPLE
jgi:hypothetical protein